MTGILSRPVAALAALAILATPVVAISAEPASVSASFTATDAPFPNPERGFYRPAGSDLANLDPASLADAFAKGYRLVYARIDLAPYRDGPLPRAFLDRLDAGFAIARAAGVKLIVRATYNYPRGETDYHDAQDAPLPIVLGHLAQLKPLFAANVDGIAFVQAGFIGAWGEWHSSYYKLTEPAARNAIKDALLDAVPANRFVQFRYPPYIREWLPDPVPAARIGFHNDCFLASQTDVGTFSETPGVRAAEQEYIARVGAAAPFGGETCNPADDPGAEPRTRCADILSEGARYHLTYLNADYYRPLFHNRWAAEGCADRVAANMGYRLQLMDIAHSESAAADGTVAFHVRLRNTGWARLYNPRGIVILLRRKNDDAIIRAELEDSDLRALEPGEEASFDASFRVPEGMKRGAYEVMVSFPDPSPRLTGDPRFAIRPANADVPRRGQRWDGELGALRTGTAIRLGT